MIRNRYIPAFLIGLILVLFPSVLFAGGEPEVSLAPFQTFNLDGETVTEEIFAPYDLSMVNVWGTFCQPCISEMPDLGNLYREYEPKGVQIVGIVVDVYSNDQDVFMEKLATARSIIEYTQADYPHLLQSADLSENYLKNVQVIPTTFFVDSEGTILGKEYISSRSENSWRRIIDKMIEDYVD
ncbi:MAG: TlpA disulfide reductase family protein [Sphaerochaetaceae bacterium]